MTRHAPLRLWQEARELLSQLWNIFGAPSAMAKEGFYSRNDHGLLSMWLRGCEAMVRALLFMEAVELCVAGDLPAPKHHSPRPCTPRQQPERDLDQSEQWRVRFRVFDRASKHAARKPKTTTRLGPRLYLAWPLAERAEALLRVFNNPEFFARRLARKLKINAREGLRINTSGDSHPRVIMPHLWDEVRIAVADSTDRLPDSS